MLFDQLGDFIQQIPTILYLYVCVPLCGLSLAIAWFAWIKPRVTKKKTNTLPVAPSQFESHQDSEPQPTTSDLDLMDMPDLNMLVNPSGMSKREAPILTPKPIISTPSVSASTPIQKGTKYRVRLHTGDVIESEEIISVLRDPRDGRLVVYVDNTGYRTLVDTPDVKARFVQIMKELSDVVTKPDERPESVADTPMSEIEDSNQGDSFRPEPIINTAPPPPIDETGAMPGDLPSYRLEDNEGEPVKKGRFGRVQMDYQPAPELNIAAAIEAYLQHKLKHTPEYYRRNIHVHSAPDGGVRIEVDGQFYEAVGDVDDPEIRAFLGATIQEWQDRQ